MFDKLKEVEKKYNDVSERLSDPSVISDQEQYKRLMREHKQLTPIVDKLHEYEAAKADCDEAKALLDEGGLDRDFKEMVEEQLIDAKSRIDRISE